MNHTLFSFLCLFLTHLLLKKGARTNEDKQVQNLKSVEEKASRAWQGPRLLPPLTPPSHLYTDVGSSYLGINHQFIWRNKMIVLFSTLTLDRLELTKSYGKMICLGPCCNPMARAAEKGLTEAIKCLLETSSSRPPRSLISV